MSLIDICVGIDLGGTNTVVGFVGREGQIYYQSSLPTEAANGAENLFNRLAELVTERLNESSTQFNLLGIGIGAPNGNYYNGKIEQPPNLGWDDVSVQDLLGRYFDVPIVITNDANAAALGEMKFGAAQGMKDFIEITLGTGLGSGLVVNGALVYGHDGHAGELGHTIVVPGGRLCNCGRRGCLETYVSANGLVRTTRELLAGMSGHSSLQNIPSEALTAAKISESALQGDNIALQAYDYTAEILARSMANAVAYLSPEAIIFFGGLVKAGDLLFAPLRRYFKRDLLEIYQGKVQLLPSALPEGKAAILGAAALIWNEL